MITPLILLMTSLAGTAAALLLPGWDDLLLLTVPATLASLFLAIRAFVQRPKARAWPRQTRWIIVDGSNVMYWQDGTPQIATVRAVIEALTARGYTPGIVFDANAGYKISDSYKHDQALGQMLGLPEDRVMVVPKGTQADPVILAAARDLHAPIVSNDRYADWAEAHPEVERPGQVIRGGFRKGTLWLDLATP